MNSCYIFLTVKLWDCFLAFYWLTALAIEKGSYYGLIVLFVRAVAALILSSYRKTALAQGKFNMYFAFFYFSTQFIATQKKRLDTKLKNAFHNGVWATYTHENYKLRFLYMLNFLALLLLVRNNIFAFGVTFTSYALSNNQKNGSFWL